MEHVSQTTPDVPNFSQMYPRYTQFPRNVLAIYHTFGRERYPEFSGTQRKDLVTMGRPCFCHAKSSSDKPNYQYGLPSMDNGLSGAGKPGPLSELKPNGWLRANKRGHFDDEAASLTSQAWSFVRGRHPSRLTCSLALSPRSVVTCGVLKISCT